MVKAWFRFFGFFASRFLRSSRSDVHNFVNWFPLRGSRNWLAHRSTDIEPVPPLRLFLFFHAPRNPGLPIQLFFVWTDDGLGMEVSKSYHGNVLGGMKVARAFLASFRWECNLLGVAKSSRQNCGGLQCFFSIFSKVPWVN